MLSLLEASTTIFGSNYNYSQISEDKVISDFENGSGTLLIWKYVFGMKVMRLDKVLG